jgi:uncharacterized repeat protein (TIGR03806 family)
MRFRAVLILPLHCFLLAAAIAAQPSVHGDDGAGPAAKPFGLTKRVPWTTSRIVGSPEPPPPYRLQRVFPRLKFQSPVCIVQEPETNRLLVGENNGKIYAFPIDDPDVETPALFLDMKRPIYAFSFHPDYKENGHVFVFSPTPAEGTPGPALSRVSRFKTGLEFPRVVRPDSEQVIIEWPSGGHNGGEAIIGPDGYLYICTGDGTGGSDLNHTGQGVNDLLSVMMRIDVDHPDPGRNYSIPSDNPFINHPGARPEVWAHGFRNPWRMSFDPETGRLWVGDVGQDLWEMIWVVQKGGNYGWSVQEGSHPFHPHKTAGPGPILPPVVEHHHTECRSITGGYVYHGPKFPELRGAYIYGDYQYGKIWGLRYDGRKVTEHKELADTAVFIAGFAVSRAGEIYAIDNSTGFIHALERTPPGAATSPFPLTLSQTGLFATVKDHEMAPGVIPYSVNAPYWSDGAHKKRYLALPGATQISDASSWAYPDGMVAVQTLSLDREQGNPRSRAPIETRILVKQDDHWMGYTYLWNDARTEATLVGPNGTEHTLTITDPAAPGGTRRQTWRVPGRTECMFCHSRAAGFVLGLNTSQMNKDHDYSGVVDNQIRALDHIGIFKTPLTTSTESLPRFIDPYDEKADLNDRARTYLHVNCSICHVSDGGGNSFIELAYGNTLGNTKLVGGRPVQGTFGIADPMIVAPGEPDRSVLYYRIATLGAARMPRVGSRVVDEKALELFYDWIAAMPSPEKPAASNAEREETTALLNVLQEGAASPADSRAEAIRRLTATTSRALALASALGQEMFPASVRGEIIAATKDHPTIEVRDLFERFVPESERIARLGEFIDPRDILELKGDAGRGRAIFAAESAVNCKSCHLLDDVGVELGPDLSKIGAKYPRGELLHHLLEPSRFVDPKYTVYHLATNAGRVHSGLLVERNEREIALRDAQNQEIRVAVSDVEVLDAQKQSLMPDLLLRSLTAQQAADLLEYLSTRK